MCDEHKWDTVVYKIFDVLFIGLGLTLIALVWVAIIAGIIDGVTR